MTGKQGRKSSIVSSFQSLKGTLNVRHITKEKGSQRKIPSLGLKPENVASPPSARTSQGLTSNYIFSRDPTPPKPPKGGIISHGLYRKEGRTRQPNVEKGTRSKDTIGQVRLTTQMSHARGSISEDRRPSIFETETDVRQRKTMAARRIRLANRLENLRTIDPKDEEGLESGGNGSQIPLTQIPSYFRRSARPRPMLQVTEPQPRQYWLGRFVTLTNAFHYEDSFNQPDIATGFGILSSYSRPLGYPDADLSNYRIKRAFMVLENACTTEKASASLRAFCEQYVKVYGDSWMR